METSKLNQILNLLYRLFDIRITFFDMKDSEISEFDIKEMSSYCKKLRLNSEFNEKCNNCDKKNLEIAKQRKEIHIYECHASLTEGIIPLYNKNGLYLGAIVFGQFRNDNSKDSFASKKIISKRYKELPKYSEEKAADIASLLKYLSEYIIENELILQKSRPWAEALEQYIEKHLLEGITLKDLGEQINRSASFVSHYFKKEFGLSAKQYILKQKMLIAKKLLKSGSAVREVAEKLKFYDEFHFSKAFKIYWGKSPKHFKS